MKLVVIGLGSMGKRRIKLLKNRFDNIEIIGVDKKKERCREVEKFFNVKTYKDLDTALKSEKPNGALVCTHPLSHFQVILKCLENNLHVFTEINLIKDGYDKIMQIAKEKNLKIFLSSTFLYRKEIQYIKKMIKNQKLKVHYRYHVGQYLPDWHPWENFKDFFVNEKRTNACRELFAIELPWIIKTFGKVKEYKVLKDKISNLDLNYYDSYIVLLKHETGHKGVLNIDIVSRKPVRHFEAYSENLHIFWFGTPDSLKIYDLKKKKLINIKPYENIEKSENYAENIIENPYFEELEVFIKKIRDNVDLDRYTFEDDIYTLDLIDKIEGVAEK